MTENDTIAALSSAAGPAGRVVVRASGPLAVEVARSICEEKALAGGAACYSFLTFGNLRCPGWVYSFRSPRSYTGENLVEFHLPGSPVLAKLLLAELFARGVRPAEPGEFTARAYFAGKLDLTEAEGVAATIAASNEQELQAGRQLLSGELARRLRPIMEVIAQTLALVEVEIDFSEEDVTFLPIDELLARFEGIDGELGDLLEESSRFEKLAHEPRIVLVGRPNAGKSTLINALVGQERAVVSSVAGTTRDVLTAGMDLPHGKVQLIDAAGLVAGDPNQSEIDRLMRRQSLRAVEEADRVLVVRDVLDSAEMIELPRAVDFFVLSKGDLVGTPRAVGEREILVSARSGLGMEELREALDRLAFGGEGSGAALALNGRHVAAVEEARAAIARGIGCTREGRAELIALELREALDALGRVLGVVTADDVLGRIFSGFCIGK